MLFKNKRNDRELQDKNWNRRGFRIECGQLEFLLKVKNSKQRRKGYFQERVIARPPGSPWYINRSPTDHTFSLERRMTEIHTAWCNGGICEQKSQKSIYITQEQTNHDGTIWPLDAIISDLRNFC